MKKINYLFIPAFILFILISCREIESENISELYTLPSGKINGEQFLSVPKGGEFIDEGITSEFTPVIIGTVDTNTAGVYIIAYRLEGSRNDFVTLRRYIGVYDPAIPDDLPIKKFYRSFYNRAQAKEGAAEVEWIPVKGAKGWYTISNLGGVGGASETTYTKPVYVFNHEPNKIYLPVQEHLGGSDVQLADPIFDYDATKGTTEDNQDAVYSYGVRHRFYGTALRYFKPY